MNIDSNQTVNYWLLVAIITPKHDCQHQELKLLWTISEMKNTLVAELHVTTEPTLEPFLHFFNRRFETFVNLGLIFLGIIRTRITYLLQWNWIGNTDATIIFRNTGMQLQSMGTLTGIGCHSGRLGIFCGQSVRVHNS